MKRVALFLVVVIVGTVAIYLTKTPTITGTNQTQEIENQKVVLLAEGLDTPWALAFLPDRGILVTERPGRVRVINKDGELQDTPVAVLENVEEIGEGGLMGIALHPNFQSNHYIYFYYTYSGSGNDTFNRVVRIKYENNALRDEEIIVDRIPGNFNHNGGRIKFGPDNLLYITTGDAQDPSQAQDTQSLAGKVLRTTDKGLSPSGNPFNNLVYSYGHRNPQGIAWTTDKKLWETEHGRSGEQSGLDELNMIEAGKNFGWPVIQGDQTREGMVRPLLNSGSTTWAPAGTDFIGNSLFFGGLRGQTLYEAVIRDNTVATPKEHFQGEFGRIREVITGPDKMLYITTSNQDGRGNPSESDDKILRINPAFLND